MKLIVGVPVKNDLESLEEMIVSLYESTKMEYTIVFVVGEGCNKETIDYITDLPFRQGVSVLIPKIRTKTPLEAYNYLFNYAKEQKCDLFVTQTDVLFSRLYKRDWLGIMHQLAQNSEIGAITCINGTGVSGQDYINGLEWLGGHCTYYPFRTLEIIGGYDSEFPNGYGVDIDYTYKIGRAHV